jgi:hypothetical protein
MMEYHDDDYYSYKLAQGQDRQVGTDKSDDEPKKVFIYHQAEKRRRRSEVQKRASDNIPDEEKTEKYKVEKVSRCTDSSHRTPSN